MKYFVGIDGGLDGAIVTLEGRRIEPEYRYIMPTVKPGKGRKVDLRKIRDIFAMFFVLDATVILEDPGGHAQSASGLRSMTYCFAALESALVCNHVRHHIVRPVEWQREFWKRPKMPKGQKFDTKAAALSAANQIWPEADWRKSERATNPHDGIVDAALIAEYGRRKNL